LIFIAVIALSQSCPQRHHISALLPLLHLLAGKQESAANALPMEAG
jgi:hypothetical protein